MLNRIYYFLHRQASKAKERGEYSAGYWHSLVRKKVLSLCAEKKGNVLEVCCGEGLFLLSLAERHSDLAIWGVDYDAVRVKMAKDRMQVRALGNVKLSYQDATALNFPDGYFDAVVCINTFFNLASLDEVKKVLLQMKRVCKESGSLIFDFRNSLNLPLKLKYRCAFSYDATVRNLPLRAYSPEEIISLLKELNLSIYLTQGVGFPIKRFAPIIIVEVKKR